ncbi:MAG: hypothetical protein WKF86_07355 [Acidimicrobiales bacterium]
MGKSTTKKPSVGSEVPQLPEDVTGGDVVFEPCELGGAHVVFDLDAVPGAEVTLCLAQGRMVGLVVRGEVSTRALQRIPVRTLERYALAAACRIADKVRRRLDMLPEGAYPDVRADFEGLLRAGTPPPASSTRERRLAWVAARYLELCEETGSPTKALAEELHLSAATVRDQLGDARRRGLLLSAGPGLAGGELTEAAKALLTADKED